MIFRSLSFDDPRCACSEHNESNIVSLYQNITQNVTQNRVFI